MSASHSWARIEAELTYLRNTGTRPVNYTFDPPPGVPRFGGEPDTRRVSIRDARQEPGLTLDTVGFEIVEHRSSLARPGQYEDEAYVREHYYPEVIAVLRQVTGAAKVVVFDHTLRDSTPGGRDGFREPVHRVHDDQTLDSAPRRVSRHLPPDEAAQRLKKRFAVINFWRPIGGPVLQSPLAVCDARSLDADDFVPSDLVYRDWTGETYSVTFNPKHRWYYYPRQRDDEVTLLKIYDSSTDGRARLTAHTAFHDPLAPVDAPARRSIEARTLVFWD